MALKEYYLLLEIAPTASADEVKRAFRTQIARYHPDKVQHLGKEFQAMAADRAGRRREGGVGGRARAVRQRFLAPAEIQVSTIPSLDPPTTA